MADKELSTALVTADSFDNRFTPISLEKPRCLLPLVDVPLLHYTLEFLVGAGMKTIIIYCRSHADKIKQFIKTSIWGAEPNVEIKFVVSDEARGLGDALREIFDQGIITTDFVLVSGDVVSNMKLDKAIEIHKTIRKKDKNVVMTTIFKKASPTHRSRSCEDSTIIAINKKSRQLLHYDNSHSKELHVDPALFLENPVVEFRYDLIDCRIDICTTEVLVLFSDNFDYQDLRNHFVHGILGSELGHKVQTHIITGEYAARVRTLNTYVAVSKDIMQRWCYPMVPDNNITGSTSFQFQRPNIYKERDVILSRSANIGHVSTLGQGTRVGDNSLVQYSTIGRNCKIGNNVTISNSFLWNNVVVENGSTIKNAIVCDGVIIKKDTHISEGCVLSFGVVVGPSITLPSETKIVRDFVESFFDLKDQEDVSPCFPIDLGAEGKGFQWKIDEDSDPTNSLLYDPEKREKELEQSMQGDDNDEDSDEEEEEEIVTELQRFHQHVDEVISPMVAMAKEITQQETENIATEINGLRHGFNRTWAECATAITLPIFLSLLKYQTEKAAVISAEIKNVVSRWKLLFKKYIRSEEDGVDFITSLQQLYEEKMPETITRQFQFTLEAIYDEDLVTEDSIVNWASEQEQDEEAQKNSTYQQCKEFVKWLQEAEEEDDEEEGEEGEEEDEDGDDEEDDE